MRAVAVALEVEDAVDEVLEHARAGDGALLRHVADEERRDALLLGHAQEPAGRLAHLRHGAGRGAELGRVERLDGVDDADVGLLALERRADLVEVRLGQDVDVAGAAEPVGAQLHLRRGLLAGDEHGLPLPGHGLEGHEQERGLADPGVAGDEDEARGDEAAAEHAVELGDSGRDPLGLGGLDLDEPEERPTGRLGAAHPGCGRERALLDQAPPRPARGTAAEPLPGRVPALGACVLEGRLRHRRPSLGRRSDAEATASCRICADYELRILAFSAANSSSVRIPCLFSSASFSSLANLSSSGGAAAGGGACCAAIASCSAICWS